MIFFFTLSALQHNGYFSNMQTLTLRAVRGLHYTKEETYGTRRRNPCTGFQFIQSFGGNDYITAVSREERRGGLFPVSLDPSLNESDPVVSESAGSVRRDADPGAGS